MSELPPPTGRPVAFALRTDPWIELARQEKARKRARRRRRRNLAVVGAVIMVLAGGGAAAWLVSERSDGGEEALTRPSVLPSVTEASAVESSVAPVLPISDLVAVEEVWLLNSGDGTHDWGVAVRSLVDETASSYAVTAAFVDAVDRIVATETRVVAQLGDDIVLIGGSADIAGSPQRIDVSIVAAASPSGLADDLADLRATAVERIGSGTLDDDDLVGRVEIADGPRAAVIEVSAVWRGERGDVVAAVFSELSSVETDTDGDTENDTVEFEMLLRRAVVPPGPPSSVGVRWSS